MPRPSIRTIASKGLRPITVEDVEPEKVLSGIRAAPRIGSNSRLKPSYASRVEEYVEDYNEFDEDDDDDEDNVTQDKDDDSRAKLGEDDNKKDNDKDEHEADKDEPRTAPAEEPDSDQEEEPKKAAPVVKRGRGRPPKSAAAKQSKNSKRVVKAPTKKAAHQASKAKPPTQKKSPAENKKKAAANKKPSPRKRRKLSDKKTEGTAEGSTQPPVTNLPPYGFSPAAYFAMAMASYSTPQAPSLPIGNYAPVLPNNILSPYQIAYNRIMSKEHCDKNTASAAKRENSNKPKNNKRGASDKEEAEMKHEQQDIDENDKKCYDSKDSDDGDVKNESSNGNGSETNDNTSKNSSNPQTAPAERKLTDLPIPKLPPCLPIPLNSLAQTNNPLAQKLLTPVEDMSRMMMANGMMPFGMGNTAMRQGHIKNASTQTVGCFDRERLSRAELHRAIYGYFCQLLKDQLDDGRDEKSAKDAERHESTEKERDVTSGSEKEKTLSKENGTMTSNAIPRAELSLILKHMESAFSDDIFTEKDRHALPKSNALGTFTDTEIDLVKKESSKLESHFCSYPVLLEENEFLKSKLAVFDHGCLLREDDGSALDDSFYDLGSNDYDDDSDILYSSDEHFDADSFSEDPMTWEERFDQLSKFYNEYQHCRVPDDFEAIPGLKQWVNLMITEYKQYQRRKALDDDLSDDELDEDPEYKGLTENRIAMLDELDFDWTPLKKPEPTFNQRLESLRCFVREHGHCRVPLNFANGLGKWVNNIRVSRHGRAKMRADGVMTHSKSTLTPQQVVALDKLGFVWDPKTDPKETWNTRLNELMEFKRAHRHTNVPKTDKTDSGEEKKSVYFALWRWCVNQCLEHKKLLNGEESLLTKSQLKQLESASFNFNLIQPGDGGWKEKSWDDMYQELINYKSTHGHTNVSSHLKELSKWVNEQKEKYIIKRGKPGDMVTEARISMLDEIGFVWGENST